MIAPVYRYFFGGCLSLLFYPSVLAGKRQRREQRAADEDGNCVFMLVSYCY